jgi:hypothetical protein
MKKYLTSLTKYAGCSGKVMETGDHFKNGASPKSLMNRKKLYKSNIYIALLAFGLILSSCNKEELNKPDPKEEEIVLALETHIVTSSENDAIVSVEDDQITFKGSTLPANITTGSILVSDITDVAPGGYLRKITAIQTENGQTVVKTEQATLVEAIEYASVRNSRKITAADVLYIELPDGTQISQQEIRKAQQSLRAAQAEWFPVTFEKEIVIYDKDKDDKTTEDQIKLKGEMTFQLTSEFDIDIDGFRLEYLKMGVGFENESKLTVSAKLEGKLSNLINKQLTIATIHLTPFSAWIGPIPVPYASQKIELVLLYDGSISAKLTTGFTCKNSISAALEYKRSTGMKPVFSDNSNFQYTPFDIKLQAKFEPGLGLYWRVNPYLLDEKKSLLQAGPQITFPIEATLGMNGGEVSIDWLVNLHMVAKLGFVDVQLINYDEKWEMAKGNLAKWQFVQTSELETLVPYNITNTTAMCGGHLITNFLNMQIQEMGICYVEKGSLAALSLTTDDEKVKYSGTPVALFNNLQMKDLKPNTGYQVRAYVKNQAETIYGEIKEFTTSKANDSDFSFIVNGQSVSGITVNDAFWLELRPSTPVESGYFKVWYHFCPEGCAWQKGGQGYSNIVPPMESGKTETLYAQYFNAEGDPVSEKKGLIINYK